MSHMTRIGIACVAAGLSLAACNGDQPGEAPPEQPSQESTAQQTPGSAALDSEQARYSYTIGYQIGSSLKQRLEDIDGAVLAQGVQEGLAGGEARLKPEEMQTALQGYQQMQAKKIADRAQAAAEEGQAFLEANRNKDGIEETESGLQYQVLTPGTGAQPGADDTVEVQYRGTLLNGQEFDSSYARGEPVTLPVNGVIPGWQEALQLMKEGAKWKIFVPPQLAYGEQGAGEAIGPNETLVFEIELLSIKDEADKAGTDQPEASEQPGGNEQPAAPDTQKEPEPAAQ